MKLKFRAQQQTAAYLLLFVPYGLAMALADTPTLSFFVAWSGSLAIVWLSLSGYVKPLPYGRSWIEQVMRPIVLTQLIFVGYSALSSIFTFLDVKGYHYFDRLPFAVVNEGQVSLLAAAQRYYVLAHGALVAGLLVTMDYRTSAQWRLRPGVNVAMGLTVASVGSGLLGILARMTGELPQMANRFAIFALVGSVLSLASALRSRQPGVILVNIVVYCSNVVAALLSGWKEQVIIVLLLLALFAYPLHRRLVTVLTPTVLLVLLFFLPAYNTIYRQLNWSDKIDASTAAQTAFSELRSGNVDLLGSTWDFLVHRASEIGMFTRYIQQTPSEHPFYGLTIVRQTAYALVPRLLWKSKPNVENLVMERAYQAAIATKEASVSAKPQFVVDGYLSAGALGVAIACFLYGLVASYASQLAERWFGGYTIGSGLIFNALFISMWRGNCFEFLTNDVAWGFVLMYALFALGKRTGWLVRAPNPLFGALPLDPRWRISPTTATAGTTATHTA